MKTYIGRLSYGKLLISKHTYIYIDSVEYLQDYTFIKKSSQGCIESVKHRVMHSKNTFYFQISRKKTSHLNWSSNSHIQLIS